MLTESMLNRLWPHVEEAKPGLITLLVASAPAVFAKYGLNSSLVVAHAMAQFSEEIGADMPAGKIEFEENLSYSVQGLMKTWPSRFPTSASASPYAHNPKKLADNVYGSRMGNRPGTDDGWNYRGRSGSQITGYDGYAAVSHRTGLDLISNPDLANDPAHFLDCSVGDFVECGCLPFAQKDDVRGVSHHLNGGYIGLDVRERWLAKWKLALNAEEVAAAPAGNVEYGDKGLMVKAVQEKLVQLGYHLGDADGDYGDKTRAAVLAFQGTEGLATTGVVDQATQNALDTAPDRPIDEERATATADDLRAAGSQTVAHADNIGTVAKAGVGAGGLVAANQAGVIDQIQTLVSQAGGPHEALTLIQDLCQWVEQHLWIGVLAGCAGIWFYARKVIAARVASHRSGENLGR